METFGPTPTQTATNKDSVNQAVITTAFYIIPLAVIVFLIILCLFVRMVPVIWFKLMKPTVTDTEQVQVSYDQKDCEQLEQFEDGNSNRNSSHDTINNYRNSIPQRPASLLMMFDQQLNMKQMNSNDSMILIQGSVAGSEELKSTRPIRSSAIISVGRPPNYDEAEFDRQNRNRYSA